MKFSFLATIVAVVSASQSDLPPSPSPYECINHVGLCTPSLWNELQINRDFCCFAPEQESTWYGIAAGQAILGAFRASGADTSSKSTTCYKKALIFADEVVVLITNWNPAALINDAQKAQIKMQTAFDACNIPALMNFLDSRMSNLDYTLSTFSNALAQIASGVST